ncbi:MAG: DnaJ domain-containing protein [Vicinamibacterales bacterium]
MHDYFEILGVSPDARAREIQRACRRHSPTAHPDFRDDADDTARAARDAALSRARGPVELADVAIDFVDMTAVVDRMQSAFFATPRSRGW